jgi:cell wall-associated NlpC family hydrolase
VSSTLTARRIIVALVSVLLFAGVAPGTARGADRTTAAELDERIEAAARQLEVMVERHNNAREDLNATRMQTKHLGEQLGPMTRDLLERQRMMGALVSRTYQRTRSGPTVALFAADEPHVFIDKLLVLHQLANQEQRAVSELHEARTRVYQARKMLNALADQQRRQQLRLRVGKATVEGEITALKQMRAIAYAGGSRFGADEHIPMPEFVTGRPGKVVAFAFGQLGKPYRWGAAGPRSYDCSGLALAAWNAAGVGLPHNAARQFDRVTHLSRSDLRPGDLVFFYAPISHVGVYIGGGRMIHAPEYGENVRVSRIDKLPIYGFGRPS